ncbi:peroxiredoxin [Rhizohabitans arisaemae]|uniref:peroxiredoxin n=1 Tax=Rhizohabitans arisaemae TaxID=2720610 RepID=UPI0024B12572|nr:peroxiredoxin [Rhizohabitans arisaemae]
MTVEVGSEAPDFVLKNQHGTPVKLSDHRGKNVVLVFYPLAFSSVCRSELGALLDDFIPTAGDGVEVLAISVDSVFSHRAWADREGYTFPLLSDFWPHGEVARSYGVFDEEKGVAGRGTFILDKNGIVRWRVVSPIPEARDVEEYRKVLAQLS